MLNKKIIGLYISIFIIFFIGVYIVLVNFSDENPEEPILYPYGVNLGAPKEYNLLFSGYRSYLYQKLKNPETGVINEKRVTSFPTMGDFIRAPWSNKGSVTASSNKAEFPTGIYLHWYSLFEKQGWEIKYDFNEGMMSRIKDYNFRNVFSGWQERIVSTSHGFDFSIYAMPQGLAYIYIVGGGASYLLGEVQAQKVDVNFDAYRGTLHSLTKETAEDLFNRRLSYQTEEFQQAYHDGTLSFSTEQWERRMKRYNWEVVGNNLYRVKGPIDGGYVNAEMYNLYEGSKNTFHDCHAAPIHLTVYLEGTELSPNPGVVERVRFRFEDDQIMEAFEKVEALDPEGRIKLEVVMSSDLKSYRILLTNGTKGVRLYPKMLKLEDIPPLYKSVIEDPNYKMPRVD